MNAFELDPKIVQASLADKEIDKIDGMQGREWRIDPATISSTEVGSNGMRVIYIERFSWEGQRAICILEFPEVDLG